VTTRPDAVPNDLKGFLYHFAHESKRTTAIKIWDRLRWFQGFIRAGNFNVKPIEKAFKNCKEKGNAPHLILVAQTDFLWPASPVPQWVVARSWPLSLTGYFKKMNVLKSQPFFSRLHDLLFWYHMDHKAYRKATGVIAITKQLHHDLKQMGIRSVHVYPCISVPPLREKPPNQGHLRLMTAALHIGDKRKNIHWMLSALGRLNRDGHAFSLTIVGDYTTKDAKRIYEQVPHAVLTGRLSREKLLYTMKQHDVFLFASLQENWGYVLAEAIVAGLIIVTPEVYPFTEINPNNNLRYISNNELSFARCIETLMKLDGMHLYGFRSNNNSIIKEMGYKHFANTIAAFDNKTTGHMTIVAK
jgi:glycosyltransferase involved in cell wall biosynthesis